MTLVEKARLLRPLIEQSAQSLDDSTALKAVELFPVWGYDMTVKEGVRYYYKPTKRLYRVNNGMGHVTQEGWEPDKTPALYTVVDVGHSGTKEDPIPAARGMEYTYGLHYSDPEDNKLYLCQRTGEQDGGTVTLQYLPHELVGHYFVEITE